jgi:hypothetical protein
MRQNGREYCTREYYWYISGNGFGMSWEGGNEGGFFYIYLYVLLIAHCLSLIPVSVCVGQLHPQLSAVPISKKQFAGRSTFLYFYSLLALLCLGQSSQPKVSLSRRSVPSSAVSAGFEGRGKC